MRRYDAIPISNVKRTPQGGIRVEARLAKTGVQEYKNPNGSIRRELRPAEEVFKQDSLNTFRGVPVTIGHQAMVDSSNWSQLAVGHVADDVRQDGEYVASDVVVQRQDAVKGVENKQLVEVSVGYDVDYDPTPGEFEGQRFDGVQRNLRVNHLALLPRGGGRAGRDVCMRLDSKDDQINISYTENDMTPEEIQAKIDAAVKAALDKQRTDSKPEVDKLTAQNEMLTAKVADLTAQVADTSRFDAQVQARVELVASAKSVIGDKFTEKRADGSSKTNRELKSEVIVARNPKMRLDDKSSDVWIDSAYEMALSFETSAQATHQSLGSIRQDAQNATQASTTKLSEARDRNQKASLDAWKQPTSATNLGVS